MDLIFKNNIKKILKERNIKPSKKLGQIFLTDETILKKIIKTANLGPDDIVLEIGPGLGTITQEIAKKTKKVIAVEKDFGMCEILKETLKEFKNVEIIKDDILNFDLNSNIPKFKIIGNIPFYLTSPLIRKFLKNKHLPEEIILIVQKEVAQRICAKPPKTNFLAICVQFFAKPKIISYVSKESFWPLPDVDSAILKITPYNIKEKQVNIDLFFKIVSAGFSQPRKTLANNLSKKLKLKKDKIESWLLKNDVKPIQRAESLTIEDWTNLTSSLSI